MALTNNRFNVLWTSKAERSISDIFDFYKNKSLAGAQNVIKDILNAPYQIRYLKQYQIDDVDPRYRRIIVRDFKLLYTESNGVIYIMDIVCSRQLRSG
jgi:plasmid stabilization system protein ParE